RDQPPRRALVADPLELRGHVGGARHAVEDAGDALELRAEAGQGLRAPLAQLAAQQIQPLPGLRGPLGGRGGEEPTRLRHLPADPRQEFCTCRASRRTSWGWGPAVRGEPMKGQGSATGRCARPRAAGRESGYTTASTMW